MKDDIKATGGGSTTHPKSESTFSPFFSMDSYAVKEISLARAAKLLSKSRDCRTEDTAESDMDQKQPDTEENLHN
jgi:hypothetical protein